MRFVKFLAVTALLVAMPASVLAKNQWNESHANVFVPREQTISGNYYTAGELVQIDGVIDGDLFVAGGSVKVNGTVTGDIIAVAGRLTIAGPVLGDVRVAAGQVDIDSIIGKNLTVAAGGLRLSRQAGVGYEAMVFAGDVDIEGQIKKDLRGAAGVWALSGSVGQDMMVQAERIILQPSAVIGGDLTYASAEAAQVMSGATIKGQVNFQPVEARNKNIDTGRARSIAVGLFLLLGLAKLVGLWLLAIVLIKLAPKKMAKALQGFNDGVWPALGIGLLLLIGGPVAVILLAMTIIGWPLAVCLAALYVLALMSGMVLAATFLGEWLLKQATSRHWRGVSLLWSSLLGIAVIMLFGWIPIIGWLGSMFALVMGMGVLWQFERQELRRWR